MDYLKVVFCSLLLLGDCCFAQPAQLPDVAAVSDTSGNSQNPLPEHELDGASSQPHAAAGSMGGASDISGTPQSGTSSDLVKEQMQGQQPDGGDPRIPRPPEQGTRQCTALDDSRRNSVKCGSIKDRDVCEMRSECSWDSQECTSESCSGQWPCPNILMEVACNRRPECTWITECSVPDFSYPFSGNSIQNSNGQLSWYLEGNLDIQSGQVAPTSYVDFLQISDRSLYARVSLIGHWLQSGIMLSVAPEDTSGFSFTYEGPVVDDPVTEPVILWTTVEQGSPIERENAWDWNLYHTECIPIECPSGILFQESCVENQDDGCGNVCPDPCKGTGHRCYQETCHPATINDVIACEPLMKACAESPDGLCEGFIIKFSNGTCLNEEFEGCYGGNILDEGYKRGVAVLECFIEITMKQNCIPTLDCLPRLWDCRADETKGCIDLLHSIMFDQECPPVYSGPALEDCYLSLDEEHLTTDRSLSLASEIMACMQFACWDECDQIGAIKDPTRQVCFTSCDENGCSESLEEVLASGVLCTEVSEPPCILVSGVAFELNYYQLEGAEGTICQTINNTGTETSSFFVQNTLFDSLGDSQLSEFCFVTDAVTGEAVPYLGDVTARLDSIEPEMFIELAPGEDVEACVDLFQFYNLENAHQYILECPSRVLSYIDVITLHTIGAGFRGPTQEVTITTEPESLLMARPKRRWEQEDEHIYHKYERTLLQECAPDSFSDCDAGQMETIQEGYEKACGNVKASTLYTSTSGGDKTKKYFMTKTGLDNVHNGYVSIVQLLQGGSKITCVPQGSGACDSSTLAFVTATDTTKTIKICDPVYFDSPSYKSITMIHEASHFVGQGNTDDVTYQCTECFKLSAADAQRNARNWEAYPTDWCSDDDECIALDSTLMTRFGPVKASDISSGTEVLSVNSDRILEFSTVYAVSHKDTSTMTTFLQFDYFKEDGELSYIQTTPNHFIYRSTSLNNSFSASETVVARKVNIGDLLWMRIEDCEGSDCFAQSEIINIKKVRKRGFISPITVTGNVVVGGVLVSSYGAVPGLYRHEDVHYAASIARMGSEVYGSVVSSMFEILSGNHNVVKMIYNLIELVAGAGSSQVQVL